MDLDTLISKLENLRDDVGGEALVHLGVSEEEVPVSHVETALRGGVLIVAESDWG